MADGGNVELVEVDGLVVKLKLKGACGSCPSSLTTMTMGIKRRLMEKIPVRFWSSVPFVAPSCTLISRRFSGAGARRRGVVVPFLPTPVRRRPLSLSPALSRKKHPFPSPPPP